MIRIPDSPPALLPGRTAFWWARGGCVGLVAAVLALWVVAATAWFTPQSRPDWLIPLMFMSYVAVVIAGVVWPGYCRWRAIVRETQAGYTTLYGRYFNLWQLDPRTGEVLRRPGELLSTVSPDGVTARRTYDRAGRLLEIATTELGGTLSRVTYADDAAGNRIELTTALGTTYDAYDASNRLTSSCTASSCAPLGGVPLACIACVAGTIGRPAASVSPNPSDTRTTYTYDPVGNRTSLTTYLGTTTSTYDAADRLTASTGPGATTYTYNAVGNELTAGTTTFAYDLADRLVAATGGTTTVTYTWSGDGIRRSAATGTGVATTTFLVDRNFGLPSVTMERDGTGTVLRTYTYGLERISVINASGGITYEHPDGLGSVTDLVSASGVALGWTDYGPYGAIRSAGALADIPADPFGFTGAYLDGTTGLYHLRARQYDPSTGRFLSTDPLPQRSAQRYVAAYVYAGNDPVGYTDASGRESQPANAAGGMGGGSANESWIDALLLSLEHSSKYGSDTAGRSAAADYATSQAIDPVLGEGQGAWYQRAAWESDISGLAGAFAKGMLVVGAGVTVVGNAAMEIDTGTQKGRPGWEIGLRSFVRSAFDVAGAFGGGVLGAGLTVETGPGAIAGGIGGGLVGGQVTDSAYTFLFGD